MRCRDHRGARSRPAGALFVACLALGGCNLLSGLDDVNIGDRGKGGASPGTGNGATAAPDFNTGSPGHGGGGDQSAGGGHTGTMSTPSGGDGPEGGGGSTASEGGAGGSGGGSTTSTVETTSSGSGTPAPECGNGIVVPAEQCDDGGTAGGDGCSASCTVELYHQCTDKGPSACTKQETVCGDGVDNDGDGDVDDSDTDCAAPSYAATQPCVAPRVYRSVNVPAIIPDDGGGKSWNAVVVPEQFGIVHTAVLLSIDHPRVSDLHIRLIPPTGPARELSTGNGGDAADYEETFLDTSCAAGVQWGSAPFQGCYKPEQPLPNGGQQAAGEWLLEVDDDKSSQSGTLTSWALVLCPE